MASADPLADPLHPRQAPHGPTRDLDAGRQAREGGARQLAQMLVDARADTLATFSAWQAAWPDLQVPQWPTLNPPLWELGHIGWFQEFWLGRFAAWPQGIAADPDGERSDACRPGADALYHSSRVPHASRWQLALPDVAATRADLAAQLTQTLALLDQVQRDGLDQGPQADAVLYFFRLALLHEDMHHEAALYMAHALGVPISDVRWQARPLPAPPPALRLPPGPWWLGTPPGQGAAKGFVFDNESAGQLVPLPGFEIDAQVLRWAEWLPFIEDGGYRERRFWSDAGWAWREAGARQWPAAIRRQDGQWQRWRHGQWQALDPAEAACHLSAHEAEAWCRWAGRRLPREAEWECAAATHPQAFHWGEVWEWTASAFAPYPGFVPHPYRDYSAPWFDGRPVLRGASFMTQPRMRHRHYRNFFAAQRHDVPAGMRSCAVGPS